MNIENLIKYLETGCLHDYGPDADFALVELKYIEPIVAGLRAAQDISRTDIAIDAPIVSKISELEETKTELAQEIAQLSKRLHKVEKSLGHLRATRKILGNKEWK